MFQHVQAKQILQNDDACQRSQGQERHASKPLVASDSLCHHSFKRHYMSGTAWMIEAEKVVSVNVQTRISDVWQQNWVLCVKTVLLNVIIAKYAATATTRKSKICFTVGSLQRERT